MKSVKRFLPPVVGAAAGAVIVGGVWFGTYMVRGNNSVVATVGKTAITRGQLINESEAYAGSSMLSELISNQLLEDAAAKQKITATQAEINQELQSIEEQNGITSQAQLEQALQQSNMSMTDFMNQIKVSVLAQKLSEAKVKVTNEEIQTYYNQNKSSLGTPEQRTLSHIVVKTKTLADQIQSELAGGKSFATLAKTYSTDTATKSSGGSLGTVSQESLAQTDPSIATAAFKLKKGQVSQPIKVSDGYELVLCSAIQPAKVPTLAQAKATITSQIKQQNAESETQLVADLMKSEKVNILDSTYSNVKSSLENPPVSNSSGGY